MKFTIQKDIVVESQNPIETQRILTKDFQNFIEDSRKSIEEIKALSDYADIKSNMIKIVDSCLPDAEAGSIVGWIFNFESDNYLKYLENYSKQENRKIWENITKKYQEIYFLSLDEFLDKRRKWWDIWQYYFKLQELWHEVNGSSENSIEAKHSSNMKAFVQMFSDKNIKEVERDAVDLESHKNDLTNEYLALDIRNLLKDFDIGYENLMQEFVPNHHKKNINELQDYISSIVR